MTVVVNLINCCSHIIQMKKMQLQRLIENALEMISLRYVGALHVEE